MATKSKCKRLRNLSNMTNEDLHEFFECEMREVYDNKYTLGSPLFFNKDRYVFVYNGTETTTRTKIVVKILSIDDESLANEYHVHTILQSAYKGVAAFTPHPNILGLHSRSTLNTAEHPFIYVFLERMDMTLEAYLARNKREYMNEPPDVFVRQIMVGVLAGMAFMHNTHIAHCDIKPANILILMSGDDSHNAVPIPKIADFGLSCVMFDNNTFAHPFLSFSEDPATGRVELEGDLVTPWFRPIELFTRYDSLVVTDQHAPRSYKKFRDIFGNMCDGVAIDMWSVGVVFFAVMYARASLGPPTEYSMYFYTRYPHMVYTSPHDDVFATFGRIEDQVDEWPDMLKFIEKPASSKKIRDEQFDYHFEMLHRNVFHSLFSEDMVKLMMKMMIYNPAKRIKSAEAHAEMIKMQQKK